TLATLAVIGLFYMMALSFNRYEDLTPSALVAMILIATFAFQPIRNWIQEVLDRYVFYRGHYDYRRTLNEFARDLNSETDLDQLMDSVIDRLKRTLGIKHVGLFLRREGSEHFELVKTTRAIDPLAAARLDLSFLSADPKEPYVFFERTRNALDIVSRHWPSSV